MGFSFNFFGKTEIRKFNYRPRFYDPEEEARKEKFGDHAAPYIIPMRECLAGIMGITVDRVSVKATTTEKLGFVGRSEGCEVYAVALLTKQQ